MTKIIVDSSSLTQPLLLYPGLKPVFMSMPFLFFFTDHSCSWYAWERMINPVEPLSKCQFPYDLNTGIVSSEEAFQI
jgi:hypothetical protein